MKVKTAALTLLLISSVGGCAPLSKTPAVTAPTGPVTTAQQAIAIAMQQCGGEDTKNAEYWTTHREEGEWVASYQAPKDVPNAVLKAEARISTTGLVVTCTTTVAES
jgi:hypothetical protein